MDLAYVPHHGSRHNADTVRHDWYIADLCTVGVFAKTEILEHKHLNRQIMFMHCDSVITRMPIFSRECAPGTMCSVAWSPARRSSILYQKLKELGRTKNKVWLEKLIKSLLTFLAEVTIIPTYDTDVLGYWVAENEDLLAELKIDLAPSASRCTINLQVSNKFRLFI